MTCKTCDDREKPFKIRVKRALVKILLLFVLILYFIFFLENYCFSEFLLALNFSLIFK